MVHACTSGSSGFAGLCPCPVRSWLLVSRTILKLAGANWGWEGSLYAIPFTSLLAAGARFLRTMCSWLSGSEGRHSSIPGPFCQGFITLMDKAFPVMPQWTLFSLVCWFSGALWGLSEVCLHFPCFVFCSEERAATFPPVSPHMSWGLAPHCLFLHSLFLVLEISNPSMTQK